MSIAVPLIRPITSALPRAVTAAGGGGGFFSILDGTTLSSAVTFTRASAGTYFDSAGVMQTAAVNVPRFDYDPATLTLRGLLIEEQRTNLILNSAAMSTQSVTVAATDHTLSFTGTGTVTLSGASTAGPLVGTGASNRVTLTFTPSAGTLTLTVSGSVTLAQCEPGAFATSYIPTAGATVTRAGDVSTTTGIASALGLNNAEGTIYARFAFGQTAYGSVQMVAQIDDGTNNNRHILNRQANERTAGITVTGGGTQAALIGATMIGTSVTRLAYAYKANDFAICRNGGTVLTDVSGTVPAGLSRLLIGEGGGFQPINGWILDLRYYPSRRTNAELQAITA